MSTVVIRERLADERRPRGAAPSQIESRSGISDNRIRRSPKTCDDGVALGIGEIDEKSPAGRGIRRKRQAQQAAFASRGDDGREFEKIGASYGSILDRPDVAV